MARGMSIWVNIGARALPSLNATTDAVTRRFAKMNRGIRLQAAETRVAMKEMMGAVGPLAAMAAAGGLTASLHGIFGEGNEYAHQISQLRLAGRTTTEVAKAIAQANKTMAELPTATLNDNLKILNETTMAFGGFQHAAENLTFNQKLGGMLDNMLGDKAGDKGENAYNLIKSMEMRGMGTKSHPGFDTERYQREAGYMYQSMIATGGKVNPAELLGYMKQANPYMKGMSDRFLYRIAPSLMQEFGGDKAGTMQNTWTGTVLGKAKNKISTEAWMKLGLLDPKQVVYNKVGPVGWNPGAIKGTDLALKDPLMWSEKVLIPALRSHGFDTSNQLSLAKALIPLFRDRNANRLANMFVGDQDNARMHKDEGLINKVPNLDAAYMEAMKNDPRMALAATATSLKNLETTLGKAVTPEVIMGLQNMAKAINWLAGVFDRHPNFAKGVVGLLGFGAVTATLKVFGIGLRWAFAPLKWLATPLLRLGGLLWRVLGPPAFRLILMFGTRLLALAPIVGEAIMGVFALVSNPVGWTILAVLAAGMALALILTFKKQIGAWLAKSWDSIKATFVSVDWGSVGKAIAWAVADGMTFGLASRIPAIASGLKSMLPSWGGSAPAKPQLHGLPAPNVPRLLAAPHIAGKRAGGGPVMGGGLYLVGERGPELFRAPHSGSIITSSRTEALLREAANHGRTARRSVTPAVPRDRRGRGSGASVSLHGATIIIQDARDPHATAHEVKRVLHSMAAAQAGNLSD